MLFIGAPPRENRSPMTRRQRQTRLLQRLLQPCCDRNLTKIANRIHRRDGMTSERARERERERERKRKRGREGRSSRAKLHAGSTDLCGLGTNRKYLGRKIATLTRRSLSKWRFCIRGGCGEAVSGRARTARAEIAAI